MKSILIVESDAAKRQGNAEFLKNNGYVMLDTDSADLTFEFIQRRAADMLIVNPDAFGTKCVDIVRQIRSEHGWYLPIILNIDATYSIDLLVAMLRAGADDYIVGDLQNAATLLRIATQFARSNMRAAGEISYRDLVLDPNARSARRGDNKIELTPIEYRLLAYFVNHPGQALSRPQLLRDVWNKKSGVASNIVDVYVRYLRVKIDENYPEKLIHTDTGQGYRFGE